MTDDTCNATTGKDEPCQNPSQENGFCWIPSHNPGDDDENPHGRPSKFEDHREDILDAAEEAIKTRDVARTAGVGKSTLYDWLDEYEDFSDAFRRARSRAARKLVQRGLDDPDTDTRMVTFLLERTFDYIKTEKKEITGGGGGALQVEINDTVVED